MTKSIVMILAASAAFEARTVSTPAPTPRVASTAPVARMPIELANNHVYVAVSANGTSLQFILDTGAPRSFFDIAAAKRLGLDVSRGASMGGAGDGPGLAGGVVRNGVVTIAPLGVSLPVTSALDLSGMPMREGHAADGILGGDFLRRYVVAIDYVARELRVYDRGEFTYTGGGSSVPLTFAFGLPHIDAELELGDGQRLRGPFTLDVGSSLSLTLTRRFTEENRLRSRVGPTVERTSMGASGRAAMDVGRVKSLRIGGATLSNVTTGLSRDTAGIFSGIAEIDGAPLAGNIGGDVLRRFTLYLDLTGRRVIVEPHSGTTEPFEVDMSGATFVCDSALDRFKVERVQSGSPAADAGLVAGDRILMVDGAPTTDRTLTALRQRLRVPDQTIVLTVERAGSTQTVRLKTRRLV